MRSTLLLVLACLVAQDRPAAPQAAPPQRTEAQARERAETNRRNREQQRVKTGAAAELIADYVKSNIGPVPESLGLNPFYKKHTDAMGIPVVSSEKVPDAALLVARDIVNTMLASRPDIRKALIARRWRTGVIAEVEMTMDIPEYSRMKRPGAPPDEPVVQADRDYHANRSRGLGGNPTTGAEENLLGYPGTRYWGEHIFVHEFAHAMMTGIRDVDPAMHAEIRAAYDAAMAAKKYVYDDGRKHYATTNANEYWAEGVQWWFFSNYGECFADKVKVETPEELAAYRSEAERADRTRLHDATDPDGRVPRQAHPAGHLCEELTLRTQDHFASLRRLGERFGESIQRKDRVDERPHVETAGAKQIQRGCKRTTPRSDERDLVHDQRSNRQRRFSVKSRFHNDRSARAHESFRRHEAVGLPRRVNDDVEVPREFLRRVAGLCVEAERSRQREARLAAADDRHLGAGRPEYQRDEQPKPAGTDDGARRRPCHGDLLEHAARGRERFDQDRGLVVHRVRNGVQIRGGQ